MTAWIAAQSLSSPSRAGNSPPPVGSALLHKINHVCDETGGTNRPGSVGDRTSEWALRWEAERGEPFRSPAGHGIKLRDYRKVIRSGIADISAKQGSVDNKQLKVRIQNTIQRAEQRDMKRLMSWFGSASIAALYAAMASSNLPLRARPTPVALSCSAFATSPQLTGAR